MINNEIKKLNENKYNTIETKRNESNYVKKGLYYEQLKPWFEIFPNKNIGVFSTEEFKKDGQKTYNEIFSFLDLPEYIIKDNKIMEKGDYSPIDKETRTVLSNFYELHNELRYITKKVNTLRGKKEKKREYINNGDVSFTEKQFLKKCKTATRIQTKLLKKKI